MHLEILRRALWAAPVRVSSPSSFFLRWMVSASIRAALCLVTRSPMFSVIMEPVAQLNSGSRLGRSRINTVCLCFNRPESARGAVGSTVIRWERSLGVERASVACSQSTTVKKSFSRLDAKSAPRSLRQALDGLSPPGRSIRTNGGGT